MITKDAAVGTLSAFDAARPNIARVYNAVLGGKDNISQVVSCCPHNGRTVGIQARHTLFSNIGSFAVRGLYRTSMGINVRFVVRGFLTLA